MTPDSTRKACLRSFRRRFTRRPANSAQVRRIPHEPYHHPNQRQYPKRGAWGERAAKRYRSAWVGQTLWQTLGAERVYIQHACWEGRGAGGAERGGQNDTAAPVRWFAAARRWR